jgi:hypothetical protein
MKATINQNRKQKDWIDGLRKSLIAKGEFLADGRKQAVRCRCEAAEQGKDIHGTPLAGNVPMPQAHTFKHSRYRPPIKVKRPYNGNAWNKDGYGKPRFVMSDWRD